MINASFKVFWNNPIEMVTNTSPQQLEFNLPLGVIIADPNAVVDLSNYDTKAEVDAKVVTANTYTDIGVQSAIDHTNDGDAALYIYVDSSNSSQDAVIAIKADKSYVDSQNTSQDTVTALKANITYVDSENDAQDAVIATKASTTYVDGKIVQTVINGVTDSAPSQDAVYDRLLVKQNLPTGYLTGWQLSVNTLNNTKFDISAGSGIITDFTDLNGIQPEIKQTLSPLVSLTPQFLLTHPSSYIAFDKDLNVIQSSSPFTNEQRRTLIILGSVIHSNNININVTNEIKAPIVAPTNQVHDFMLAVGAMNLSGNEIVPNGNNLAVNITAGTVWKMGVSASNQFNPHQVSFPLRTTPLFTYRLRNSTEYAASTLLDPTNYDLNGVRTPLSNNNRWSIQRFYLFQSGLMRAQYGQAEYSSYQNALNSLLSEPFQTEQNIRENGLLIGRIILKKTCVDLITDISLGIASIHVADKFGNTSAIAPVTAAAIISALGYTPQSTRKTVNNQTTAYTLQLTDAANIVRATGTTAFNITVPNSSTVAFTAQDRIEVQSYGTGTPTVVPAAGVTIRVAGGGSLALTQQYSRVLLEYVGSNEWILFRA